ncbi:hypothetical protein [Kaistella palustris]|uniref:hypothetical protein n=1 Tax=Kaistella palustris TaxID=493376 RepID=UPI0004213338|nr:hypothetical protein [Kaistella palustris]
MRTLFGFLAILATGLLLQGQQVSLHEIASNRRFEKLAENERGENKIKYSDVLGIPYYRANFIPAKVGNTDDEIPVRYNSFLDTVEVLNGTDVYELPKDETSPEFTFVSTHEKLVFVKTNNSYSGYFFEVAPGKNRILKKIITTYYPPKPAANTLIPGDKARFESQKPIYFVQSANGLVKIPKNEKEFAAIFPEKKTELTAFIKKNNIKLNNEEDLVKLGQLLNQ